MNANNLPPHEKLPSGKVIRRRFNPDGSLNEEVHVYGAIDVGISFGYENGVKIAETYFAKSRLVSRRSYEKARANYPDMPAPDPALEDWGAGLLKEIRVQQKERKLDKERRLAESEESRFPRPAGTNWLRVIGKDRSHLVVFASRDWKILAREGSIPCGRHWLRAFGFDGASRNRAENESIVMKGLETGFEVAGDRAEMLEISKALLNEVVQYANNPPEVSRFQGSIRPRRKPRRAPTIGWPAVLPPLIEFLSGLTEEKVKIFNHHQ
jgi:hypothetical protein